MSKGFDKIKDFEDDDIVVGKPMIRNPRRPISVQEIVTRLVALENRVTVFSEIATSNPNEANQRNLLLVKAELREYAKRLYSPA